MTQIFEENGMVVPVTVIQAGPCPVVQVRDAGKEGYRAVQLGYGAKKANRSTKSELGHAAKAGLEAAPAILREFRVGADASPEPGQNVTVEAFETGSRIKVTGTTKGRGFAGVVKRHGFGGGKAHRTARTHGCTAHPAPSDAGTNPSRVIKGKKHGGHMGHARQHRC
jgi:large subunit ribosomal protein L3